MLKLFRRRYDLVLVLESIVIERRVHDYVDQNPWYDVRRRLELSRDGNSWIFLDMADIPSMFSASRWCNFNIRQIFLSFYSPKRYPDRQKGGAFLDQRIYMSSLKQRLPPALKTLLLSHPHWVSSPTGRVSGLPFSYHYKSYAYCFEDDSDLQAAAGADSNLLPIAKITKGDLELVATGTWIRIKCRSSIVGHILNFDLIVERHLVSLEVQLAVCSWGEMSLRRATRILLRGRNDSVSLKYYVPTRATPKLSCCSYYPAQNRLAGTTAGKQTKWLPYHSGSKLATAWHLLLRSIIIGIRRKSRTSHSSRGMLPKV